MEVEKLLTSTELFSETVEHTHTQRERERDKHRKVKVKKCV